MFETLMRFDVRMSREEYVDKRWDAATRDQYLLNPDVPWPLSVDKMVWPSVFYSHLFQSPLLHFKGSIHVDPDKDDGEYWLNLDQMKRHYQKNRLPSTHGVPIAIQIVSEEPAENGGLLYLMSGNIQCGIPMPDTNPKELPQGSHLLGYDVADGAMTSGLTNCGYRPSEKQSLAPTWSPRLNEFGLLFTLADALEFKKITDKRVPEHVAFWIYRISQLPE